MTSARAILGLLPAADRRRAGWLLGAILLMALGEVMGIASIFPFLSVVADPTVIERSSILSGLYDRLGFTSTTPFLVFLGAGFLAIVVITSGFTALTTWLILRFTWNLNHSFSERLLTHYLARPYPFFLDQNSADLGKNVLFETKQLVSGVIVPGMQMLARGVAAALICVLLVALDPGVALVGGLALGGAYTLVYVGFRRVLAGIGHTRLAANRQRYTLALEALGGIKELKVLGRESAYVDRYRPPSKRYADSQARFHAISTLPRYGLEVIAIAAIVAVTLYLLVRGGELAAVIPLLGLYAFAGLRLLPALQQVFTALATVRSNLPVLDLLAGHLALDPTGARRPGADGGRLPLEREVRLAEVTYTYPNAAEPAVRGVSIVVPASGSVGIVGRTGAGKTTLLDLILGLLEPEEGDVVVDGRSVTGELRERWQRNLGYVPQNLFLADDTIAANIAFGIPADRIDTHAVKRAAGLAQIHGFVSELPAGYETLVGERGVRLSGGQRQRVAIARALYHDPDVLVFDEATSALDGETEQALIDAVNRLARRKTIILVAHRLNTVRHCDVIYCLERGRVTGAGTFAELLQTNPAFVAVAGSSAPVAS